MGSNESTRPAGMDDGEGTVRLLPRLSEGDALREKIGLGNSR